MTLACAGALGNDRTVERMDGKIGMTTMGQGDVIRVGPGALSRPMITPAWRGRQGVLLPKGTRVMFILGSLRTTRMGSVIDVNVLAHGWLHLFEYWERSGEPATTNAVKYLEEWFV